MARGRLISRTLGSSRRYADLLKRAGRLGEFCQVLYPLIVANTDDFGRLEGDAFTVKHVVLPSSPRPERDFDLALEGLTQVGLIDRYEVNGGIYLQVKQFDTHQPNLHKRTSSKFPESPGVSENYRPNIRESNLTQNPEPRTQKGTQNPEPRVARHAVFNRFWAAYPKKIGKGEAEKAWGKLTGDETFLETLLAALERQQPWLLRENGKYIPNPSTWLNQRRWEDEPPAVHPQVSSRSQANLAARERLLKHVDQSS